MKGFLQFQVLRLVCEEFGWHSKQTLWLLVAAHSLDHFLLSLYFNTHLCVCALYELNFEFSIFCDGYNNMPRNICRLA